MNPFLWLRNLFLDAWRLCVYLAMDCFGTWMPLDWLGYGLISLGNFFVNCATALLDLINWYDNVTFRITEILSASQIYDYFKFYFDAAIKAWNWVLSAAESIRTAITSWWLTVSPTVLAWIATAKTEMLSLLAQTNTYVASLQTIIINFLSSLPDPSALWAWFTNWTANVWGVITAWWEKNAPDVGELTESTILAWFPFYNDLVALWGDIKVFFADPLEWVYNKLDEWFERFW